MRSAAEVNVIPLAVKRNFRVRRQVFDNFNLVMFAARLKQRNGIFAADDLTGDFFVAFDDFVHFFFNLGKIFSRERLFAREVVIETVFNERANRYLNVRPQLLNGFGHNVRTGVAQNFKPVLVFGGDNFYFGVGSERGSEIF